jgi:hypothetical protein
MIKLYTFFMKIFLVVTMLLFLSLDFLIYILLSFPINLKICKTQMCHFYEDLKNKYEKDI